MVKLDLSKVFSFSKMNRFEKCPLDYYFYYLDPEWKGYQKPKDYKTKGSAVHGALTLFYYLPPEQRTADNLKDCLRQAWFSDFDVEKEPPLGEIGGFRDIDHERKVYWQSLKLLESFFSLGDINPPLFYVPTRDIKYSFVDYEEMIQPLDERFFISGKFDRIDQLPDGSLRIIDFKTGKQNQDKVQLDFYRLLAELNFNIPVKQVSFYYLADGQIVDFPCVVASSDEMRQGFLQKMEKIQSVQEFQPQPSKLCDYCDFKKICPIFKKE